MRFSFLILGVMMMLTVPTRASNLSDDGYEADREPVRSSVDPDIIRNLNKVPYHLQGYSPKNLQTVMVRESEMVPSAGPKNANGKLDSEVRSPRVQKGRATKVRIRPLPYLPTSSD